MSDADSSESSDDSDSGFNEIVTLGKSSEFETVRWRFPDNIVECPLKECMLKCSTRRCCLKHFVLHHAEICMICPICDELFLVKMPQHSLRFLRHYQMNHPNAPQPKLKETEDDKESIDETAERKCKDELKNEYEISLNSLGISTKYSFPDTNKCQNGRCKQQFKDRVAAIKHFREHHAGYSILCSICQKPIAARMKKDFVQHYHRIHPDQTVPYGLDQYYCATIARKRTNESKPCGSRSADYAGSSSSSHAQVKEEYHDDSDLVQLKYGKWHFPETTSCPFGGCGIEFGSRLDALLHYKQRHAMHAIFCTFCNKPIRIDAHKDGFYRHFRQFHPNQKMPYGLDNSTNEFAYGEDDNDDVDDKSNVGNDLIKLTAWGVNTQYPWPKAQKHCPVRNCQRKFENESDAIVHYKTLHADGSVFCSSCDKPFRAQRKHHIRNHYAEKHPNEAIPFDLENSQSTSIKQNWSDTTYNDSKCDDNDLITLTGCNRVTQWRYPKRDWQNCPNLRCRLKFDTRSEAISHYKAVHSKCSICCPICDKPIAAYSLSDLRQHYVRIHVNKKFPDNIGLRGNFPSQMPQTPSSHRIKDEAQEDGIIELFTCDITTEWKPANNCRLCPVMNCRKKFPTKLEFITHYKSLHAHGSICCPACDQPIRSPDDLRHFVSHWKNKHSDKKLPAKDRLADFFAKKRRDHKPQTHGTQGTTDDDGGDMIILRGCSTITKWKFPNSLRDCPNSACAVKITNRAELLSHYRNTHAEHSILCELCDRPIAAKTITNFTKHYKSVHPNVPVPLNNAAINDHSHPKVERIDAYVACDLCNKRIEPEDMDRHMEQMHGNRRIYCPFKLCTYEATTKSEIRMHWDRKHSELKFPEFRDGTDFTYMIDDDALNHIDNDDGNRHKAKNQPDVAQPIRNGINGGSSSSSMVSEDRHSPIATSADSDTDEIGNIPMTLIRRFNEQKRPIDSNAWFADTAAPNDDDTNDVLRAKHPKTSGSVSKRGEQRKRYSSISSISSDSVSSSQTYVVKPRQVARKRVSYSAIGNTNRIHTTKPITANNPIKMKECSVAVETMERINSNTVNTNSIASTSTTHLDSSGRPESSTSVSSNEVVYVADSDEEMVFHL